MIVETAAGTLRGATTGGVHAFKGIPYAAAARFQPPTPVRPWDGIREADAYGPTAPQPPPPPWRLDQVAETSASGEDCLVLNVWSDSLQGRKPVLVWFHGGGFSTGSGSLPWYDGSALAGRGDVVVVTLNHRLGLLGFLDLGSVAGEPYTHAGNAGMLDLVSALAWVRDNITAFGGDPDRVTIFGESGGGGKVCAMLAMPAARGLFHGAAIQSGVFHGGPGERGQTPERAAEIAAAVIGRFGSVEELLAAPVERLIEAQQVVERVHRPGSGGVMPFCPIADGQVVVDHPLRALATGVAADVPLVIGTNAHETTLFLWLADPGFRSDPHGWTVTDDELATRLRGYAGDHTEELVSAYRIVHEGIDNRDLFIAISSDNMRIGSLRLAEARLQGGGPPVYSYLFTWESPLAGGALGASHGFEIPFVFDTAERRAATRQGPGRERLAEQMSTAWGSFSATGIPTIPGLGVWPAYTLERRATAVFGAPSELADDPGSAERRAWSRE